MQCPKCTSQLPDDARFCGMCGTKFDKAAEATPSEPFGDPQTGPSKPVRFFDDTTSKTDVAKNATLKEIADLAMAGAPIPGSGSQAPVPTVSAAALPAVTSPPAAAAPAREKNVDPVTRQPFEFRKEDLAKALSRAAKAAGKPAPDVDPADLTAFYKAGEKAGIPRKGMEDALHKAALERMDTRPPGTDAPLTSELESIKPSGQKYVLAGVAVLGIIIIVAVASSLMGGDGDKAAADAASSSGAPAASGGEAPKPAGDHPKRHAGEMDKKAIAPAIEAVAEKARACHEAARKANPKVAGRVLFDVELEEDGTFSKLAVKEDSVGDARMVECVKREVQAYAWPRPKGGFFAMEFPLSFEVAEQGKAPAGGKKGKKR